MSMSYAVELSLGPIVFFREDSREFLRFLGFQNEGKEVCEKKLLDCRRWLFVGKLPLNSPDLSQHGVTFLADLDQLLARSDSMNIFSRKTLLLKVAHSTHLSRTPFLSQISKERNHFEPKFSHYLYLCLKIGKQTETPRVCCSFKPQNTTKLSCWVRTPISNCSL